MWEAAVEGKNLIMWHFPLFATMFHYPRGTCSTFWNSGLDRMAKYKVLCTSSLFSAGVPVSASQFGGWLLWSGGVVAELDFANSEGTTTGRC